MKSLKLDKKNIKSVVGQCFKTDVDLYSKWHINAGQGVESCVERTSKELEEMQDLSFYAISQEDTLIGFFGIEKNVFLSTIFVKPEYRKSKYMGDIWVLIKSTMTKPFYSSLYKKNDRCINFYTKNKGQIIKETEHMGSPVVIFEFKE